MIPDYHWGRRENHGLHHVSLTVKGGKRGGVCAYWGLLGSYKILLLLCNPCWSLRVLVTTALVLHTGGLVLDVLWVVFRDGDFLIVLPQSREDVGQSHVVVWWVWKGGEGSLLCVYKSIFNPVLEYFEGFLLSGVNLAADLVLSTLNTGELVFGLILTSSFSAWTSFFNPVCLTVMLNDRKFC